MSKKFAYLVEMKINKTKCGNYLKDERVTFFIGDIRDYDAVFDACNQIDYVFHAAALKQVPSCEFYPLEAIKTNIIGTDNLLKASIKK